MRNRRHATVAAWLAGALLFVAGPAAAESSEAGKAGSDFGVGVVTVVSNVGYMPVKLGYALLGGVTGSLAWVLTGGDRQVADGIWVPSMGGDYVLTTDMMTGEEDVSFHAVRERAGEPGGQVDAPARVDGADHGGGEGEDLAPPPGDSPF